MHRRNFRGGGYEGTRTPTFKSGVLYPSFWGIGTTALYAQSLTVYNHFAFTHKSDLSWLKVLSVDSCRKMSSATVAAPCVQCLLLNHWSKNCNVNPSHRV